jgi:hypothetical protein
MTVVHKLQIELEGERANENEIEKEKEKADVLVRDYEDQLATFQPKLQKELETVNANWMAKFDELFKEKEEQIQIKEQKKAEKEELKRQKQERNERKRFNIELQNEEITILKRKLAEIEEQTTAINPAFTHMKNEFSEFIQLSQQNIDNLIQSRFANLEKEISNIRDCDNQTEQFQTIRNEFNLKFDEMRSELHRLFESQIKNPECSMPDEKTTLNELESQIEKRVAFMEQRLSGVVNDFEMWRNEGNGARSDYDVKLESKLTERDRLASEMKDNFENSLRELTGLNEQTNVKVHRLADDNLKAKEDSDKNLEELRVKISFIQSELIHQMTDWRESQCQTYNNLKEDLDVKVSQMKSEIEANIEALILTTAQRQNGERDESRTRALESLDKSISAKLDQLEVNMEQHRKQSDEQNENQSQVIEIFNTKVSQLESNMEQHRKQNDERDERRSQTLENLDKSVNAKLDQLELNMEQHRKQSDEQNENQSQVIESFNTKVGQLESNMEQHRKQSDERDERKSRTLENLDKSVNAKLDQLELNMEQHRKQSDERDESRSQTLENLDKSVNAKLDQFETNLEQYRKQRDEQNENQSQVIESFNTKVCQLELNMEQHRKQSDERDERRSQTLKSVNAKLDQLELNMEQHRKQSDEQDESRSQTLEDLDKSVNAKLNQFETNLEQYRKQSDEQNESRSQTFESFNTKVNQLESNMERHRKQSDERDENRSRIIESFRSKLDQLGMSMEQHHKRSDGQDEDLARDMIITKGPNERLEQLEANFEQRIFGVMELVTKQSNERDGNQDRALDEIQKNIHNKMNQIKSDFELYIGESILRQNIERDESRTRVLESHDKRINVKLNQFEEKMEEYKRQSENYESQFQALESFNTKLYQFESNMEQHRKQSDEQDERKSQTLENLDKSVNAKLDQLEINLEQHRKQSDERDERRSQTLEDLDKSVNAKLNQFETNLEQHRKQSDEQDERKSQTLENLDKSVNAKLDQLELNMEQHRKQSDERDARRSQTLEDLDKSVNAKLNQFETNLEQYRKQSDERDESRSQVLESLNTKVNQLELNMEQHRKQNDEQDKSRSQVLESLNTKVNQFELNIEQHRRQSDTQDLIRSQALENLDKGINVKLNQLETNLEQHRKQSDERDKWRSQTLESLDKSVNAKLDQLTVNLDQHRKQNNERDESRSQTFESFNTKVNKLESNMEQHRKQSDERYESRLQSLENLDKSVNVKLNKLEMNLEQHQTSNERDENRSQALESFRTKLDQLEIILDKNKKFCDERDEILIHAFENFKKDMILKMSLLETQSERQRTQSDDREDIEIKILEFKKNIESNLEQHMRTFSGESQEQKAQVRELIKQFATTEGALDTKITMIKSDVERLCTIPFRDLQTKNIKHEEQIASIQNELSMAAERYASHSEMRLKELKVELNANLKLLESETKQTLNSFENNLSEKDDEKHHTLISRLETKFDERISNFRQEYEENGMAQFKTLKNELENKIAEVEARFENVPKSGEVEGNFLKNIGDQKHENSIQRMEKERSDKLEEQLQVLQQELKVMRALWIDERSKIQNEEIDQLRNSLLEQKKVVQGQVSEKEELRNHIIQLEKKATASDVVLIELQNQMKNQLDTSTQWKEKVEKVASDVSHFVQTLNQIQIAIEQLKNNRIRNETNEDEQQEKQQMKKQLAQLIEMVTLQSQRADSLSSSIRELYALVKEQQLSVRYLKNTQTLNNNFASKSLDPSNRMMTGKDKSLPSLHGVSVEVLEQRLRSIDHTIRSDLISEIRRAEVRLYNCLQEDLHHLDQRLSCAFESIEALSWGQLGSSRDQKGTTGRPSDFMYRQDKENISMPQSAHTTTKTNQRTEPHTNLNRHLLQEITTPSLLTTRDRPTQDITSKLNKADLSIDALLSISTDSSYLGSNDPPQWNWEVGNSSHFFGQLSPVHAPQNHHK